MSTVSVSEQWSIQALRDLHIAKPLAAGGYHEWASYASQQAAEKAIKAVRYSMAIDLHVVDDKKKEDRNKRDFTHNLLHLAEPLRELWPKMLPTDADLGTLMITKLTDDTQACALAPMQHPCRPTTKGPPTTRFDSGGNRESLHGARNRYSRLSGTPLTTADRACPGDAEDPSG